MQTEAILWMKVVNSLLLMVVFKCLICRNMTTSLILPLFASHLQELKSVIPRDYHHFFDGLPHC